MVLLSFRMSTIKVAGVLAGVAVIASAAAWEGGAAKSMLTSGSQACTASVSISKNTSQVIKLIEGEAATNEQRINYLKSLGWQVSATPLESVEIIIPSTFNKVYENYNKIQTKQGFDLSNYKGKRVKRWTYTVTNYPGVSSGVRVNLLVYNGKVIGGDVSSVALNGFMQGLSRQISNAATGISADKADIVSEMFNSSNH